MIVRWELYYLASASLQALHLQAYVLNLASTKTSVRGKLCMDGQVWRDYLKVHEFRALVTTKAKNCPQLLHVTNPTCQYSSTPPHIAIWINGTVQCGRLAIPVQRLQNNRHAVVNSCLCRTPGISHSSVTVEKWVFSNLGDGISETRMYAFHFVFLLTDLQMLPRVMRTTCIDLSPE